MLPGPEKIGPYTILARIGAGGMATVYRAIHPKNGREVALKVLAIHLVDENEMRRFEREAHTLLQFRHPHILPVYDFGEDNGTPYLVMKLLGGRLLDDLLKGQPLPLAEIGRFTRQIASALDYAHARGIVHRDVKPANILLDDMGIPYLADFGVACWSASASSPGERLTQAGTFVGTAAYASPEQCEGKPPDRPSDIYSLAVMVFEMATGRLPFESSSSLAVIKMHLRDAPPNPLAYNPHLPIGLYVALVKALAKLPENRYPSAMKFSEAIDAALGLPVQPDVSGENDWLYDDIQPVSPDGPAAWTIFTGQSAPTPADNVPILTDPYGFDANADYGGPADPFANLEMAAAVAGFAESDFDDQFDLDFEPLFENSDASLTNDFADEADLEPIDPFPSPALVLGAATFPAAAPPVIRPLRPQPQPQTPSAEPTHLAPHRLNLLLIALAAAFLIGAVALIAYALIDDSSDAPNATYRSENLGVVFEYPSRWHILPTMQAVFSSASIPALVLSDKAHIPSASRTVVIQHIDPVEVYSVPSGCMDRIFEGPALTFACMANHRYLTPVYEPFDTPHYAGSVYLPGTLPLERASMPAVLLPTGKARWLALVIITWDGTGDAQGTLARIARSVRPI